MWSLSYLSGRLCAGADQLRNALLAAIKRLGAFASLVITAVVGGALFIAHAGFGPIFALIVFLGFVEMLSSLHRKPRLMKPLHVEMPTMGEVRDGKLIAAVCAGLFGGWVATALVVQVIGGDGS